MDLTYLLTQSLAFREPDTEAIPSVPLDRSFAHGWNKLPSETKAQIIAYNSTNATGEPDMHIAFSTRRRVEAFIILYAYCNPEFGTLMQEAVYRNNTFAIVTGSNKCRLPSLKYRPLIRQLVLHITMYRYFDRSGRILENLQDGTSGFTQLFHLKVKFCLSFGKGLTKRGRGMLQRKFRLMAKEGHVSIIVDTPLTGVHNGHLLAQAWDVARGNIEFWTP
jgi:hypothetical protein